MNQEPNFDKLDLGFLPVTERLDGLRNECYSEVFPEFYRILIDGGIGKDLGRNSTLDRLVEEVSGLRTNLQELKKINANVLQKNI